MALARKLPFIARSVPHLLGHAGRVSRRRRAHGPQLPGWEFPYEVLLSVFRERFSEIDTPPPEVRAQFDALGVLSPDLPRVRIQPVDADGVRCVWFTSRRPSARTIFYLHGGGYMFGSARSHAPLLAPLARLTGARVFAVNYRLAPEHPCPAALDDALTAWRWLRARGVRARDITFAGDSAGGGLSLATMLALRDAGEQLPARSVLLSPWTDLSLSGESLVRARHCYLPSAERFETIASWYLGDLDPRDPRASPLWATDLSGLPPILTLAGGEEAILDDSTRLHQRLREAGVDSRLHVEPHEIHVYPMFTSLSERARDGMRKLVRFVE